MNPAAPNVIVLELPPSLRRSPRVEHTRTVVTSSAPPSSPAAHALALAHQVQDRIDRGELADRAEAARRLGVTRTRMSQIMALLALAPAIQEQVLAADATGCAQLSERRLLTLARAPSWQAQLRSLAAAADRGEQGAPAVVGSLM